MKKQKPNISLLRKVQKAILKHPRQFNMSWWFQDSDSTGKPAVRCGTAACLAGWAMALSPDWKGEKLSVVRKNAPFNLPTVAGEMLRMPVKQAKYGPEPWQITSKHKLFFHDQWPIRFRKRYEDAISAKEAAQAASDRISYFIKTGK